MVIGGGISGVSTALEASEAGQQVILIEKNASLGGRVSRFHQYFPKLCPPTCGLEINYRRLRGNPEIEIHTGTEVNSISGEAGSFKVKTSRKPRYVTSDCVNCGKCEIACPVERGHEFNCGMNKTRAIYLPHKMAYPPFYVIDREACQSGCSKCVEACSYQAIDLEMEEQELEFEVASLVFATGWRPYRTSNLTQLGFHGQPDVINNVMMERLSAVNGPTEGKLERPSDGKPVESVAFVQCAGSRDENHLSYCSAICCLASLKQATYVLEQNPEARVYIFYIDIRTPGKYEDFVRRVQEMPNVNMIKGKVAKLEEGPEGRMTVVAEDVMNRRMMRQHVDLVVLATGMEPNLKGMKLDGIHLDDEGFLQPDAQQPGIYAAGVAKRPVDVNQSIQDATGTALKAIQTAGGF